MKRVLLSSAVLALAMGAPAMAADLVPGPVYKAPVMAPAPIYDWTGFYIGINGGYGWGDSSTALTLTGFTPYAATNNLDGWVFGGQAGYNWQFTVAGCREWPAYPLTDLRETSILQSCQAGGEPHAV